MGRIDYAKVRYALPQGEAGKMWRSRLDSHIDTLEAFKLAGDEGGYKLHTDYNPNLTHTTKYLEVWGKLANSFYETMFASIFGQDIMRLDYRIELPDEVDLGALADKAEKVGRRQYQFFNQRVREKSGDRSAGGIGLAKGSHKSERRVSIYKRGSELPAAEVQLRGKSAGAFHTELRRVYDIALHDNLPAAECDPRDMINAVGTRWLDDDLSQEVGVSVHDLITLAAHTPYDEAETRLATLDALWDSLDKQEKTAFIQAKLFGDDGIVFRPT